MSILKWLMIVMSAMFFSGCAGMSAQEKCVVGGALIGGVAGSVLTDQSSLGTLGGAAVGGVVGHEIARDRRCP